MLNGGLSQTQVDAYFKIDGDSNPLETADRVKLYLMRPEASLGGGPGGLVFDPTEMKAMVNTGKDAAQDFIAKLDPRDVTWMV